jgi:hypothetical protein
MDYILVERESFASKINAGARVWRLTFYCLTDGTFWEMTVDSSYRNYRKKGWDHVVQDPSPWAVYQDLPRTQRTAKSGFPVVSADAEARIDLRFRDRDQALAVMSEHYQGRNPEPPAFGDLFE